MHRKTGRKQRNPEVDKDSVRILRSLKEKESFHFYTAVGKPTGQNAESLSNFYEKIKSIDPESLTFHIQRKDFQNWIKKTLGDSKLSRRISRIRPLYDDNLREKICTTVENRIKELREA
jgi:hypothetical protein